MIYLKSNDMKVIHDILEVYNEGMKKRGQYIPTQILGAINRFNFEVEHMEKEIYICPKCGNMTTKEII